MACGLSAAHLIPAELLLLLTVQAERTEERSRYLQREGKVTSESVCVCNESVSGQRRRGKAKGGKALLVSEN